MNEFWITVLAVVVGGWLFDFTYFMANSLIRFITHKLDK
jgi:hypothetical protein